MNKNFVPSVRQLQAFSAVYRLRKLGAAASQLFVTQSAVSVLIRQLEEGLGVLLFERTTRSLQPTQAAHDALVIADRILRDLDGLSAGFRDVRDLQRGQVSLVMPPTLAGMILPPVIQTFKRECPQIKLLINDCAPDQFLQRIVGEHVDFGIGTPEHAGGEVELQTLVSDHLAAVFLPDHPLARLKEVRWTDLRDYPVIMARPGYGIRHLQDLAAASAGVELRVAEEVSFMSTSLWMAASGLGVAIMATALAKLPYRQSSAGPLLVKVLQEPSVPRDIYIVTKRGRHLSPACEAFLRIVRESCASAA